MTHLSRLLLLLLLLTLPACMSDTGSFYTRPGFDPGAVKTYAWDPQGSLMEGVAPQNQQAIGVAVTDTVNENFAGRGWAQVSADEADVLVRCELGARTKQKVEQTGTVHVGNTQKTVPVKTTNRREGELTLDLIDPATGEILWRGTGYGSGEGVPSAQEAHDKVARGVQRILDHLH